MSTQLLLNLRLKDGSSFSNYNSGANSEALQSLRSAVVNVVGGRKSAKPMLFFWGTDGTGKTHLLQAACRLAQELGVAPVYVPLVEADTLTPSVLESVEQAPLICLDDVERIAGQAEWEMTLFRVIERLRSADGLLVCAAFAPPGRLGLRLSDLTSRLTSGTVYALQPLSDAGKLEAIRLRARNRGLDMPEDVVQFILSRYPRDMHSLFELLERIDLASLTQQRRVTIPFMRRLVETACEDAGTG